jgi:hypothetical protein
MVRVPFISCALMILFAACSRPDPVADNAAAENLPAPANRPTTDPAGLPPENGTAPANAAAPAAAARIPARLHGRWGLSPADCNSTRGDAKGLLVIAADDLRFYESRAVPSADVQTDAGSISGHFDFTGEGQSWSKYEALKRSGTKLTRTETNPAASYTYAKC